jgi:hypothetical protein
MMAPAFRGLVALVVVAAAVPVTLLSVIAQAIWPEKPSAKTG